MVLFWNFFINLLFVTIFCHQSIINWMIFVNGYILLLQLIALDDEIKKTALLFNQFSNSILIFWGIVCTHYCPHFKTFCRVRKCWGGASGIFKVYSWEQRMENRENKYRRPIYQNWKEITNSVQGNFCKILRVNRLLQQ
jgi:hypothetical protein